MSAKNNTSASSSSLAELQQQFDDIVAWFSGDDIEIEAAVAKYEEGARLAREIRTILTELENKITLIKADFDKDMA